MYHGGIFHLKSEGAGRVRSSVGPVGLDLDVGGTVVGVTEDISEPDPQPGKDETSNSIRR